MGKTENECQVEIARWAGKYRSLQDHMHQINRILNEAGIPTGAFTDDAWEEYSEAFRVQLLVDKTREGWVSVKESELSISDITHCTLEESS